VVPRQERDPDVGWWAREKYERVRAYVGASSGARKGFIVPDAAGATYIDPFCGNPQGHIRDTGEPYESGAIAACREAAKTDSQFTAVHVGDTDTARVSRTVEALKSFRVPVYPYVGRAQDTLPQICGRLNWHGLHLAFLDPYDISNLELELISQLAAFKRMDIIVHVSINDLQRNLPNEVAGGNGRIERFAPGWRDDVDPQQSRQRIRDQLLEYWTRRVAEVGMSRSEKAPLVRGSKRQPLYYLMFLSKHPFAERLWRSIQDASGGTRSLDLQ